MISGGIISNDLSPHSGFQKEDEQDYEEGKQGEAEARPGKVSGE